jgi:8-oxo-dGTP diphosphatase
MHDTFNCMTSDRNDEKFLETYDASLYAHPSLAVDIVVTTVGPQGLCVLLVKRSEAPQKGQWGLPGGFVGEQESVDECTARVLLTKAGLERAYVEQLYTFSALDRDPRTRVVSLAHMALVDYAELAELVAANPAKVALAKVVTRGAGEEVTASVDGTPVRLAFDHGDIVTMAVIRLRGKLDYAPVGFELLPRRFTLRQLQAVHEAILSLPLNKDSFRRRMVDKQWIIATGERRGIPTGRALRVL